jgi:hypothetical protein
MIKKFNISFMLNKASVFGSNLCSYPTHLDLLLFSIEDIASNNNTNNNSANNKTNVGSYNILDLAE